MGVRVLAVIGSLDLKGGGPQDACLSICKELQKKGISPEIAVLEQRSCPGTMCDGLKVHGFRSLAGTYRYSPEFVAWLRSHAREYKALFVHGLWGYWSFGSWLGARKQVPYFVYPHGMLDPWFKRRYPLKHVKKWCYWHFVERRVLQEAEGVLFTCEEERKLARESFGYAGWKEVVIPYGVSDPQGEEVAEPEAKELQEVIGKRVLLFIGRLHPKKGCDLLLEAFAKVCPKDEALRLVFVGPDGVGWGSALRKLARRLGIEQGVLWVGPLYGRQKWWILRQSELLVLPSHQENFARVVGEALGCGVPVLVTNKVNTWQEVERFGAGLVCEDHADSLTKSLRHWLQTPEEERKAFKAKARKCFEACFSIERTAQAIAELVSRC